MQYLSTRGGIKPISFTEAVIMGLGEDGGLLLPRTIPRIGKETFSSWKQLNYQQLAYEIMSRFIDDIAATDLQKIINRSCANFTNPAITPLLPVGDIHILELFHGPTLAFKDIALQFLGNLFEYLLNRDNSVLNIIGATSGDTGSAAIYGVRGKQRINIFILHPKDRISKVQEKQMTTVTDANVFNIAIEGSFDDGQARIKEIFNDTEFKKQYHLGAINSINWARILAQVVYYVYSTIEIVRTEQETAVDFSIPTGNFGDIFAGYIARRMLPEGTIRQLILATNDNDILSRAICSGDYSLGEVKATSSPSMDIQAASNFERYLYYLMDSDSSKTRKIMESFAARGKLDFTSHLDQLKRDFAASAISEQDVEDTIALFYQRYHYLLDPHTAVGVGAALRNKTSGIPIICLATAHPAKFPDTVAKATGITPQAAALKGLLTKEAKCKIMPADKILLQKYIEENALRYEENT
ncbi:MAG: threonine synthase [Deltaproteobacteria bacterium]|nr:MAG: threonine synthase [Deltaproteobacteria bacterium]